MARGDLNTGYWDLTNVPTVEQDPSYYTFSGDAGRELNYDRVPWKEYTPAAAQLQKDQTAGIATSATPETWKEMVSASPQLWNGSNGYSNLNDYWNYFQSQNPTAADGRIYTQDGSYGRSGDDFGIADLMKGLATSAAFTGLVGGGLSLAGISPFSSALSGAPIPNSAPFGENGWLASQSPTSFSGSFNPANINTSNIPLQSIRDFGSSYFNGANNYVGNNVFDPTNFGSWNDMPVNPQDLQRFYADQAAGVDMGYGPTGMDNPMAPGSPGAPNPGWAGPDLYPNSGMPQWIKDIASPVGSALRSIFGPSFGQTPGINGGYPGNGNGSNGYSFPFANVLGSILNGIGARSNANTLRDNMRMALDYADPAHGERPFYQAKTRELASNPSNFFSDPAIQTAINLQQDATARKLSSQGYNLSGNYGLDVNKAGMSEAFKNYLPWMDQMATYGGLKNNYGSSGSLAAGLGPALVAQNNQANGSLGAAFNSAMTGNQPSYLDQIFGKPMNQTLPQLFSSMLS